jgi:hypothetical protein
MTRERIERLYFVTASENKFNDYQFLLGKFADLFWRQVSAACPTTSSTATRNRIVRFRPAIGSRRSCAGRR